VISSTDRLNPRTIFPIATWTCYHTCNRWGTDENASIWLPPAMRPFGRAGEKRMWRPSKRSCVFWGLALLGIVPAVVSTTIFPFSWFSDSFAYSIDRFYLQYPFKALYVVAFVGGALIALSDRSVSKAVALVPLLLLSALPIPEVSLDRSLLSSEKKLASYGASHVASARYIAPAAATTNPEERAKALASSLRVPIAVEWMGLARGAAAYRDQWGEANTKRAQDAIAALAISDTAAARIAADFEVKQKALQSWEKHVENFSNCSIDIPQWNQSIEQPAQRFAGPRCGPRPDQLVGKRLADDTIAVGAALQAAKAKGEEDARARWNAADTLVRELDGRVYALEAASRQATTWIYSAVYSIASFVALVIFSFSHRLKSVPTAVIAAAVFLIDAAQRLGGGAGEGSPVTGFLFQLDFVIPTLYPVVLFLTGAAALRLLALAVRQNRDIFATVGVGGAVRYGIPTLLMWCPIAALIAGGFWLSDMLFEGAERTIYAIELVDHNAKPFEPRRWLIPSMPGETLEGNVDRAIDGHFKGKEDQLRRELEAWSANADRTGKAATGEAIALFNRTVPGALDCPPAGGPNCISSEFYAGDSCSWFNIKCRILRGAKRALNSAYGQGRARAAKKLDQKLAEFEKTAKRNKDAGVRLARAELADTLAELKVDTKRGAWAIFRAFGIVNLVSNLLLLIATIKSLLFIFSRFAFSKDAGINLSLVTPGAMQDPAKPVQSQVTCSFDQTYQFVPGAYFVRRRTGVNNAPPHIALPQWINVPFARLAAGVYTMNKIDVAPGDTTKLIQTTGGPEFVSWIIGEGEEVFFRLRDLVAMSENIQIRSALSFRLSSLIIGRMFFTCARGPGTLVLKTKGKPRLMGTSGPSVGFSPTRLLAWHAAAKFKVLSELRWLDVYLSDVQLYPVDGSQVTVDVDTESRRQRGAIRFLKSFLLPI
jgi:hypothetical protein